MRRICLPLVMLSLLLVLPFAAVAQEGTTVVWDESTDGDLSTDEAAPTPIAFVDDSNAINGDIGGPAAVAASETGVLPPGTLEGFDDGRDAYTFSVPAGFSLDQVILVNYVPTPGNTSSGFNLFQGPNGLGTFLGSCACTTADIGTNLLTLFGTGPLAPGQYTMVIREFGTADNLYSLDHVLPGFPVELQTFSVE